MNSIVKSKLTRHGLALSTSIAALFIPAKGMATDYFWTGANTSNQYEGGNWFHAGPYVFPDTSSSPPEFAFNPWIFGSDAVNSTMIMNVDNANNGIVVNSGIGFDMTFNGPGTIKMINSIDLSTAAHDLTINAPLAWLFGGITLNVGPSRTLTVNGGLTSDPGFGVPTNPLVKSGAGTAVLASAATTILGTTISDGTLQIASAGTMNSGSYAGAISIATGATLQYSSSADQNFSGDISGAGSLTKDTSGSTLYLSGANTNTGAASVSAGTLNYANVGAVGSTSGITVNGTGSVYFDSGTAGGTISTPISLSGDGGGNTALNVNTPGSQLTFSGPITMTGSSLIRALGDNTTMNFTNAIHGTGDLSFAAFSGGGGTKDFIVLSGASDFTGGFALVNWNGAVQATLSGGDNRLPTTALVTVHGGGGMAGALDLNGNNQTIAGLTDTLGFGGLDAGSRSVVNTSGTPVTLTLNTTANQSSGVSIGGTDINGTTGNNLNLVKSGAATQTLSGANTYTGGTTVNGGTLLLTGSAASVTSATTINSGGTLAFNLANGTNSSPITLNNGGTLADFNPNGFLVLNGAVNTSGSTAINITSDATGGFGQGFYLDGGLQGTGTVTITATNAGNAVNLRNNNTSFSGTLIVNGIASTTPYAGSGIGVGGGSTGLTNADITLNGTMELNNDGIGWANSPSSTFQMGALNGTGVIVGNSSGGTATTVTLGNTGNSGSFSGTIADGSGNVTSIVKTGAGTQTFSGSNSYSGGTTISAGTLQVTNGGALGSGNVATGGAGALTFDTSGGSYNLNGTTITGTGTMNVTGGNTLIVGGGGPVNVNLSAGAQINLQSGYLASSSSFQGLWTNNQASLNVASGAVFGLKENQVVVDALTGSGTVRQDHPLSDGNTSSLVVGIANGSGTFSGVIQDSVGAASLFKTGTGTQTLSGNNTYTGATTVNNGTLALSGTVANLSASTTVTVNAGGHLWFQAPSDNSGPFNYNNFALNLTGQGAGLKVGGNNGDSATVFFGNNNGNTYNLGGNVTVAGGVSFATYGIYNTVNLGGVFSGTGDMSFSSSGLLGHTFAFSGDSSASGYTGTYKIYGYYIEAKAQLVGGNNRLPTTATVDLEGVNGGVASLDLNGNSQQLAGLVAGSTTDRVMNSGGGTPVLTINNAAAGSFAGELGTGGTNFAFTKSGAGTFTLSGANTYTGATNVNGGTLLVSGSLSGTTSVAVNDTATLGGSGGTIGTNATTVNVNAGGTLAPGASIGQLNIGTATGNTVNFVGSGASKAVLSIELDAPSSSSDLLFINGNLNLGADDQLTLTLLNGVTATGSYTIATYTGTLSGEFNNTVGMPSGYTINYGDGSNDSITIIAVPEPGAAVSLLGGLGILLGLRRRRSA